MYLCTSWIRVAVEYIYLSAAAAVYLCRCRSERRSRSRSRCRCHRVGSDSVHINHFRGLAAFKVLNEWAGWLQNVSIGTNDAQTKRVNQMCCELSLKTWVFHCLIDNLSHVMSTFDKFFDFVSIKSINT